MTTLRQQSGLEFCDLSLAFQFAMLEVWEQYGLDAARCFALGA